MPSTSRLLTAAVILGGLIAYGSLQSNAATGPEFIRITDRQFSYKRVDIGARGGPVVRVIVSVPRASS